jgi:hypothetical protein
MQRISANWRISEWNKKIWVQDDTFWSYDRTIAMRNLLKHAPRRKHAWIRINGARKRLLSSPQKQAIHNVWHRAYIDAFNVYKQTKVEMCKSDIEALFEEKQISPNAKFCVVPRLPSQPLRPSNAILVTRLKRHILHRRWKSRAPQCVEKSIPPSLLSEGVNSLVQRSHQIWCVPSQKLTSGGSLYPRPKIPSNLMRP